VIFETNQYIFEAMNIHIHHTLKSVLDIKGYTVGTRKTR